MSDPDSAAPSATGGPAGRAARLLDGLLERLAKGEDLHRRDVPPGVEIESRGRVVACLRAGQGDVIADLDPRAGVGDAAALRKIGGPHPDRERSALGWRRMRVRTQADAARIVHALRPHREKPEPRDPVGAMLIGRVRVRSLASQVWPEDGKRVLVDDVWPRGLERDQAPIHDWIPQVAPSRPLRTAFGSLPGGKRGFRRAYLSELRGGTQSSAVARLRALLREGPLTLITAARDVRESFAVVLAHAVTHGRTPKT